MPLTPFQREVFATLRSHRSPDSFVFGATVLNAAPDTPRFVDLCHDTAAAVSATADADASALTAAGYHVEWTLRHPTFHRAVVSRHVGSVKLEWVYDSAFRFHPVEPDEELGWRLRFFDAATNKLLALSGRSEARDFVDAIHLHETYLSPGTLAWAAAGKDGGLHPRLILDLSDRFAHYRQEEIDALHLTKPLSLPELKAKWSAALAEGRALVELLPAEDAGCAYLDPGSGIAVNPHPLSPAFPGLRRHFGSVGGSWPSLSAQQ